MSESELLTVASKRIVEKLKFYPRDAPGENGYTFRATITDAFSVLQDIPDSSAQHQGAMSSYMTKRSNDGGNKRNREPTQSLGRNRTIWRRGKPLCYACRDPNHKQGSLLCTGPSAVGREMQAKQRARPETAREAPDEAPLRPSVTVQHVKIPSTGFGYLGSHQ